VFYNYNLVNQQQQQQQQQQTMLYLNAWTSLSTCQFLQTQLFNNLAKKQTQPSIVRLKSLI